MSYECVFVYGDYKHRQRVANELKAVCYIEHHFNSDYKGVGNYSCALVAHNASEKSEQFARDYAENVGLAFNINHKVIKLRKGGRGDYNLRFTAMPAVLLEPLFVSNKNHVKMLLEEDGINKLAMILEYNIKQHFPDGGKVAFSVGHKYKRTKPLDRGAVVRNKSEFTEGDLAEWVLWKTKCLLERG